MIICKSTAKYGLETLSLFLFVALMHRKDVDVVGEMKVSSLGISGLHIYSLQMMWYCWPLQAMTFTTHTARMKFTFFESFISCCCQVMH